MTFTSVKEPAPSLPWSIKTSSVALLLAAVLATAYVIKAVAPAEGWWAARVMLSAFAVAMLPGVLVVLAGCGRRSWSLVELVALSVPISAGILQIFTILSMTLHQPMDVWLGVLATWNVAALMWLWWRSPASHRIAAPAAEIALAIGLVVLGCLLYLAGSPVEPPEDAIHIGVVRRLAAHPAPGLHNIYFAPNVVYTYPYPGTHFLIAAISRFGDADALFVYHKLRGLWGPIAVALVYAAAAAVFESRRVAIAAGVAALGFVLAGPFTAITSSMWGQLTVFSHASDLAMTLWLPGLLVVTWHFLRAEQSDERLFFGLITATLVMMLAIVHTRELVQYLAYLGAYVAFLVLTRRWSALRRPAVLLVCVAIWGVAYGKWHDASVAHITTLVEEQKSIVLTLLASAGAQVLVMPSVPLLERFIPGYDKFYFAFNPLILLAIPVVAWTFRHKPFVWFVSAATLAYVVVFRSALIAGAYIYVTYFEILFTPVRNIIFFLYVAAGVALYIVAAMLGRSGVPSAVLYGLAAGIAIGLVRGAGTLAADYSHAYWLAVVVLFVAAAVAAHRARPVRVANVGALDLSRSGARVVAACLLLTVTGGLWIVRYATAVESRVVGVRWVDEVGDGERAELAARFALADGRRRPEAGNNWAYDLVDTSRENVGALVGSPRVLDTVGLDRRRFVPDQSATPGQVERWLGGRRDARADQPFLLLLSAVLLAFAGWLCRMRSTPQPLETLVEQPPSAWPLAFVAMLLTTMVIAWDGERSPLRMLTATEHGLQTPEALFAAQPCVEQRDAEMPYQPPEIDPPLRVPVVRSCAPSFAVASWADANVPVDAVFAANKWNDYLPTAFLPQQVVAFGGMRGGLFNGDKLFERYFELYRESLLRHRDQPFFNAHATREERLEFVNALGVTHVLVDPPSRDTMVATLVRFPDLFKPLYDDGSWAVYQVRR